MSKTLWRKTILNGTQCLVPACRDAEDWLAKTKLSQGVMIDPRRPRNIQHHRKLFALLNIAVDNWPGDQPTTIDALLDAIKIAAGHVEPIEVRLGFLAKFAPALWEVLPLKVKEVTSFKFIAYMPKSIAFASMDQQAFSEFYDHAVNIISKILGVDVETLNQEAA